MKKNFAVLLTQLLFLFFSTKSVASVYITEIHLISLNGSSGQQWIELYNSSTESVSLSDASISFGGSSANINFLTNDTISAQDYYVINFGNVFESDFANPTAIDGSILSGFVNQGGDVISLAIGGAVIDQVDFSDQNTWGSLINMTSATSGLGQNLSLSMMLLIPETSNAIANDDSSSWGVADPGKPINQYSNTGRHFGSPGSAGIPQVVPLPATLPLFLSALIGLGVIGRRLHAKGEATKTQQS